MKKSVADKEIEKEYKERHWTKKSLEEMTTRDYRIFREDFLITCKGEQCFFNSPFGLFALLPKLEA